MRSNLKQTAVALMITLSVTMCTDRAAFGAPSTAEIAKAVAAVRSFDYGRSRKPLAAVERLVARANADADLRTRLERELAKVLESDDPLAAKQFVCRQLWVLGTDASVPALAKMLIGADANAGEIACYALNRHPAPAVGNALRDVLGKAKGSALIAVITLLGDRRDRQGVEAIAKLASHQAPAVANAAVTSLGKIATDGAVKVLAELRRSDNARRRAAAFHASLRCARELAASGRSSQAKALYGQLDVPGQPLHIRRGAWLGRIDLGGPDAVVLVLSALRGKDDSLKAPVIAAIGRMPGENVTALFAEQLPLMAAREQVLLVRALADRGDPAARGAIARAAAHGDPVVRIAAIKALAVIGDAASVSVLVKAAAGSAAAEAKAAGISLRVLKNDGVGEAILAQMRAAKGDMRVELIDVLADRRYAPATAMLLLEAASEDQAVAKAAFEALGLLGGEKDMPAMVRLLAGLTSDPLRADAENAVVAVAGKIADPTGRADTVLAALGRAKRVSARCSLLRVSGRLAGDRAYEAIAAAANDKDPRVRDTAVRALADWPDPRAMDLLLKVLQETGNDTHRVLVLRGYVRLLGKGPGRPAELARKYARAIANARRDDEKKLILSGLASVAHADALKTATDFLKEKPVRSEAALTAIAIARRLGGSDTEAVNAAMKKVVATVQDAGLQRQADGLIRRPPPPLPDVYLGALKPVKVTSGNNGGRGKPQVNLNCSGKPLRLKGVTYSQGIGEHARADLTYALGQRYKRFVCVVGLDDQVGRYGDVRGSIVVKVHVDGKLMAQTPVLRGAGALWNFDIEIPSGAKALRLIVDDAGDGVGFDDADLVNAGFILGPTARPRARGPRPQPK